MRDLLAKVALGTPGRTKVYLLDEVHMLTSGAENALLKTLEEPPDHVVFVLATTEPHKVVETIRSRSQHLELNLLSANQLESLIRDVVADAGLEVDDSGVAHAVRAGRGSARDALSALDRVVAGGVGEDESTVRNLLEALTTSDAGAALVALADGISRGKEPRVTGEALLGALREAFLVAMGVPSAQLAEADRERAEWFAAEVTPAVITRALEILGTALVDMRRSPDPRVDLEVALVRLTTNFSPSSGHPSSSDTAEIEKLTRRVERLESTLNSYKASPDPGPVRVPSKDAASPLPLSSTGPAASGRARLDGTRAAPPTPPPPPPSSSAVAKTSSTAEPSSSEVSTAAVSEESVADSRSPSVSASGIVPNRDELALAWADDLLDRMSRKGRARFAAGRFIAFEDGMAIMALPNEPHRRRCEDIRGELETVLEAQFGMPIPVRLVVDDGSILPSDSSSTVSSSPVSGDDGKTTMGDTDSEVEEETDPSDLVDADPAEGSAVAAVTRVFPGATVIDPD
tara:strand:+ start:574 stop:2121 length:1548 start_codon:yes stop_codon:yes gene_type:complete